MAFVAGTQEPRTAPLVQEAHASNERLATVAAGWLAGWLAFWPDSWLAGVLFHLSWG